MPEFRVWQKSEQWVYYIVEAPDREAAIKLTEDMCPDGDGERHFQDEFDVYLEEQYDPEYVPPTS